MAGMKVLSIVTAVLAAGSAFGFAPVPFSGARKNDVSVRMVDVPEENYIDMERRNIMNLILAAAAAANVAGLAVPFFAFLVPPGAGGGSAGVTAKDALGNDIFAKEYLASKPAGDHSLAQGLKGDATYLIVKEDKTLENFGLNAVCTHLGCVVPWSTPNKKFICPCHGSQYSQNGAVVRGPAPLPLALAHVEIEEGDEGKILFTPWTEDDFRTDKKAWWN